MIDEWAIVWVAATVSTEACLSCFCRETGLRSVFACVSGLSCDFACVGGVFRCRLETDDWADATSLIGRSRFIADL